MNIDDLYLNDFKEKYSPNLNRVMRLTIALEKEIKRHIEGHGLDECLKISKQIREEIIKLKKDK